MRIFWADECNSLVYQHVAEIAVANAIPPHLSSRVQISAGEFVVGFDPEIRTELWSPMLEIRDQRVHVSDGRLKHERQSRNDSRRPKQESGPIHRAPYS